MIFNKRSQLFQYLTGLADETRRCPSLSLKNHRKLTLWEALFEINSWIWECDAKNGNEPHQKFHSRVKTTPNLSFPMFVLLWRWCRSHVRGQMEDSHWMSSWFGGPMKSYHAPGNLRILIRVISCYYENIRFWSGPMKCGQAWNPRKRGEWTGHLLKVVIRMLNTTSLIKNKQSDVIWP